MNTTTVDTETYVRQMTYGITQISTFIQSEVSQSWVVTSHRYGILRSFLRCHFAGNQRWYCRDKISNK